MAFLVTHFMGILLPLLPSLWGQLCPVGPHCGGCNASWAYEPCPASLCLWHANGTFACGGTPAPGDKTCDPGPETQCCAGFSSERPFEETPSNETCLGHAILCPTGDALSRAPYKQCRWMQQCCSGFDCSGAGNCGAEDCIPGPDERCCARSDGSEEGYEKVPKNSACPLAHYCDSEEALEIATAACKRAFKWGRDAVACDNYGLCWSNETLAMEEDVLLLGRNLSVASGAAEDHPCVQHYHQCALKKGTTSIGVATVIGVLCVLNSASLLIALMSDA